MDGLRLFDEIVKVSDDGFKVEERGGEFFLKGTDIRVVLYPSSLDVIMPNVVIMFIHGDWAVELTPDVDTISILRKHDDEWLRAIKLVPDTKYISVYYRGTFYRKPAIDYIVNGVRELGEYPKDTIFGRFIYGLVKSGKTDDSEIIGAVERIKHSISELKPGTVSANGIIAGENAREITKILERMIKLSGDDVFIVSGSKRFFLRVWGTALAETDYENFRIRLRANSPSDAKIMKEIERLFFVAGLPERMVSPLVVMKSVIPFSSDVHNSFDIDAGNGRFELKVTSKSPNISQRELSIQFAVSGCERDLRVKIGGYNTRSATLSLRIGIDGKARVVSNTARGVFGAVDEEIILRFVSVVVPEFEEKVQKSLE